MALRHLCIMLCIICGILFSASTNCPAQGREHTVQGRTMGTVYTIKFVSPKKQSMALWQKRIDARLEQINAGLSMYDPDSDISRFNRTGADRPFRLSKDFSQVMQTADRVYRLTSGAWDGTIKPLVDLWGFGTKDIITVVPDTDDIQKALSRTGFQHLTLNKNTLLKKIPGITLDLGSIAKGYGVDAIALLLTDAGIENFLVEIGGELSGSGLNRHQKPWSVGITPPGGTAGGQRFYKIITLDNTAIATSGNYRNFFTIQDKTYSHIIDPKTGFPVDNQVVSASVIAGTCTFADALATALMVMDPADSLALVNRLENVECLIIRKTATGFTEYASRNFHTFVQP